MEQFIKPNIYHTGSSLETVSLVTGSSALVAGAKLVGLIAENASATAGWIQVFDGYGAPASGSVPLVSIKVAATSQTSLDPMPFKCVPVSSGIVVALSSTGPTYTAIASGLWITAAWY